MGTFLQRVEVSASPDGPFEAVEALVDTGATYTLIPRSVLVRLGVKPLERRIFILDDGRTVEYEMVEVRIRIDGGERYSPCIFGDDESEPLLGAVTLEEFGLSVDPLNQRLVPVPGYLVGLR